MVLGNENFQSSSNSGANVPPPRSLGKVLQLLDDYKPMLPNSVVQNLVHEAGCNTEDERLIKLISVCGQKFISDILNDSIQIHKARTANPATNNSKAGNKSVKDRKYYLTMEDLTTALEESGIEIEKPYYFV